MTRLTVADLPEWPSLDDFCGVDRYYDRAVEAALRAHLALTVQTLRDVDDFMGPQSVWHQNLPAIIAACSPSS